MAQDSEQDHLAAAKLAAGFEFTGTLSRNCIDPAHDQVAAGPRGVIPDRAQHADIIAEEVVLQGHPVQIFQGVAGPSRRA